LVLSQYVEQLYARELLADATGGIGYLSELAQVHRAFGYPAQRLAGAGGFSGPPWRERCQHVEIVKTDLDEGSSGSELMASTPEIALTVANRLHAGHLGGDSDFGP
jgi:hypothetical protein